MMVRTLTLLAALAMPLAAPAQDDLDFLLGGDEPAATPAPSPAADESAQGRSAPRATPAPAITLPEEPAPTVAASPPRRVLEEIVVTAQKREQVIQDVPISMSALSGDFLKDQGVTDISEALQLVPNAAIDAAGFFAAPRVRGFTFNNNNKSFEPPVGMAIDGIPHTRIPYFLAALFDTERMEVLRGPQGTSFGKNTTAGLVHVISRDPTPEPEGSLTVEAGQLDRFRVEAAYGGPLADGINFRIAGLLDERDGFIRNTTAQVLESATPWLKARKRTGLRAILVFEDLAGTRLELAAEAFELFDGGAALETVSAGPNFAAAMRRYDPDADVIPGNFVASIDLPDFRDISIRRYRGEWQAELGNWSLVAIGAHAVMDQDLSLDTDFTPAQAINGFGGDHSPMTYGELRLTAPSFDGLFGLDVGLSTDFLVGLTWSRREILDSAFLFGVNTLPFADLLQAAALDAEAGALDSGLLGDLLGPLPAAIAQSGGSYEEMNQFFEQSADAASLYAHGKWQIRDAWAVELGARLTTEEKDGFWDVHFTTPPPNAVLRLVGAEEFTATRNQRERNLQPKVSLNWQPNDAVSAFLHWERGFKGGGFNLTQKLFGSCALFGTDHQRIAADCDSQDRVSAEKMLIAERCREPFRIQKASHDDGFFRVEKISQQNPIGHSRRLTRSSATRKRPYSPHANAANSAFSPADEKRTSREPSMRRAHLRARIVSSSADPSPPARWRRRMLQSRQGRQRARRSVSSAATSTPRPENQSRPFRVRTSSPPRAARRLSAVSLSNAVTAISPAR